MCPPPPPVAARPQRTGELLLSDLFADGLYDRGAAAVRPDSDPVVTGITLDSRLVCPGDLYVALPGTSHHGARFAADALRAGAVGVLTDADGAAVAHAAIAAGGPAPVIVVADPRSAMATVAARIYGRPSERLTMLAITGTTGKTTTAYLLAAALRSAGRHVGVIGTIGFTFDDRPLETARTTVTTPESPELQALLGLLAEEGADSCVLEVSSHALVLGRVDAITFDVAAFTTLGDDHLDFHGDMESYFAAKATLFTPEHTRHAVVNVDDPYGRRLVESIRAAGAVGCSTISLGASGQADQRLTGPADYIATVVEETVGQPTRVRLDCPGRTLEFGLGLPGDFNVRNAATALAMLDVVGVDLDAAGAGLPQAQVPGRLQRVALGPGAPSVYVDFAHTPQAVTAALGAVAGRRVVVLGCGGDRDRHKRAPMGAAAAGAAAVVVVTDDNPRSEDPAAIRAEVLRGAHEAVRDAELNCVVIDGGDRRSAIGTALRHAGPEDVVVILGKGHESGQEVHGQVLPFSDPTVVAEEWAALRAQVGPT